MLKAIKEAAGAIMGQGVKVSITLAQHRLAICFQCKHKSSRLHRCSICKCFVDEKVK